MGYPLHLINGVPLNDPNGRWEERADTTFLSAFPGIRTSPTVIPGVPGVRASSVAPLEDKKVLLTLRVNAVLPNGTPVSGSGARYKAIQANLDALFRGLGVGRASRTGTVTTLERRLDETTTRWASGRIEAASAIEYDGLSDFADLEIIFSIHEGVWSGPLYTSPKYAPGTDVTLAPLSGNVTALNNKIACWGPFKWFNITGADDNGFSLTLECPEGKCVIVDARTFRNSVPVSPLPDGRTDFNAPLTNYNVGKIYGQKTIASCALPLAPHEVTPGNTAVKSSAGGKGAATSFQIQGRAAWI